MLIVKPTFTEEVVKWEVIIYCPCSDDRKRPQRIVFY